MVRRLLALCLLLAVACSASARGESLTETRVGGLPALAAETHLANAPQAAESHQLNGKTSGEMPLGYPVAAESGTTVIGKVGDLGNLKSGESSLLELLPDAGSPQANWANNSGILRQAMGEGVPIRDATVDSAGNLMNNSGFLKAERNLLQDKGWNYSPSTQTWNPPAAK